MHTWLSYGFCTIQNFFFRLSALEKSKKTDLAELKMRYEGQINIVNGELQSLHNQVLRFKREKDTYKHMLETAQKAIGELKQNPTVVKEGPKNYDEVRNVYILILSSNIIYLPVRGIQEQGSCFRTTDQLHGR